ncbi:MAG: hypothetical protein H8D56_15200 [Planctomycetes bacterium]|nr:hypothetical protein [Planctomycetota bacterium]
MRLRQFSFLLIALVLILALSTPSCGSRSETSTKTEQSDDIELIKEMAFLLREYTLELKHAEAISNKSLEQVYNALSEGDITTYKYRKRIYQIELIEANTIAFIDSKPIYNRLHNFMWTEDGKAPSLAWSVPEAESDPEKREAQFEEYLQGYIFLHTDTVERLTDFLVNEAEKLGIDIALPVEKFWDDP